MADVAQCCTSLSDNFNFKFVEDCELPFERCHHCRHLGGGNERSEFGFQQRDPCKFYDIRETGS